MERIYLTEEEKKKAIFVAKRRVVVKILALALTIAISGIIGILAFSTKLLVVYAFWGVYAAVIAYGLWKNVGEMKEVKRKLADNTLTAYRADIDAKGGSRSTYYVTVNKGNVRVYISMGEYFSVNPGECVHFFEMGEYYYSVGIYKNPISDE